MEMVEQTDPLFMGIGTQYGVNQIVFGAIYVGAIPFFTISIAWLVRNYRKRLSIIMSVLSTPFFISADLYLVTADENVPWLCMEQFRRMARFVKKLNMKWS